MLDDATVFRLGDDNFRFVVGDQHDGVHLTQLAEADSSAPGSSPLPTSSTTSPCRARTAARSSARSSGRRRPSRRWRSLRRFRFLIGRIGGPDGIPIVVSRTGYTGELGYEIWCHPDDGPAVWDAVWEAGRQQGLKPLGLSALDMLRIESGLIFAGYEFDDQVDPFEAGIGFAVALESEEDFVGKAALEERKAHPQQNWSGSSWRARDGRPRRLRPRPGTGAGRA